MNKFWDRFFLPGMLLASLALLFLGLRQYYRAAYPLGYREVVEPVAAEKELDPALVYAVIRTESGFSATAQSPVDARGLMQLTPDTFQWVRYRLGEEGAAASDLLYDPWENVRYGCTNLSLLLREFDREDTALAAYHAGRGSVNRWLGDSRYSDDGDCLTTIPYRDTDTYVKKVLTTRDLYHRLYPHLDWENRQSSHKEETEDE